MSSPLKHTLPAPSPGNAPRRLRYVYSTPAGRGPAGAGARGAPGAVSRGTGGRGGARGVVSRGGALRGRPALRAPLVQPIHRMRTLSAQPSTRHACKPFEPVGNTDRWPEVRTWLSCPRGGALLLSGPVGSGKTFGVRSLARELGYTVHEINGADEALAGENRLSRELFDACTHALGTQTLQVGEAVLRRRALVLVDDVDTFAPRCVGEALHFVRQYDGTLCVPLVFTCSSLAAPAVRALRDASQRAVALRRPHERALRHFASIAFPFSLPQTIDTLVHASEGDVRRLVLSLKWCKTRGSFRSDSTDARVDVFDTVRRLLHVARVTDELGVDDDGMLTLLFENYTRVAPLRALTEDAPEVGAAEWLSTLDTMRVGPTCSLSPPARALFCAARTGSLGAQTVAFPQRGQCAPRRAPLSVEEALRVFVPTGRAPTVG